MRSWPRSPRRRRRAGCWRSCWEGKNRPCLRALAELEQAGRVVRLGAGSASQWHAVVPVEPQRETEPENVIVAAPEPTAAPISAAQFLRDVAAETRRRAKAEREAAAADACQQREAEERAASAVAVSILLRNLRGQGRWRSPWSMDN